MRGTPISCAVWNLDTYRSILAFDTLETVYAEWCSWLAAWRTYEVRKNPFRAGSLGLGELNSRHREHFEQSEANRLSSASQDHFHVRAMLEMWCVLWEVEVQRDGSGENLVI